MPSLLWIKAVFAKVLDQISSLPIVQFHEIFVTKIKNSWNQNLEITGSSIGSSIAPIKYFTLSKIDF